MPASGGISSQFGMVDETTFGTSPTVTRFLEFNDETVGQTIDRIDSSGLRIGRKVERSTQFVPGSKNVTGDIDFEWQQQGMGLLLKHMCGTIATTQPNVGSNPTVYEHKGTIGSLDGKSFTCQIAKAGTDGVQRAFTYAGCKISKWDLSVAVDGLLMLKPTIDGISESTAVGLAAASYATSTAPLSFVGGTVTLPGGASGNVSKFDLAADGGLNLTRRFLSGSGNQAKKEQLESTLRALTGSVDVEFGDLSAYNLFVNATVGSLTAFFAGANISGTYNYACEITLPAVRFDGTTPNVSGPGVITVTQPYTALDDGGGTGGLQIVYRTVDTTP